MAEDFEDAGQRYAFLLRPVKDLGKNFEINIAKELDDYCQQLRSAAENEEYDVDNQHRLVPHCYVFYSIFLLLVNVA